MGQALTAAEIQRNRKQALTGMDEEFLQCREMMHAWREITSYVSFRKSGKVREITEVLRCDRCKTSRLDRLHVPSYDLVGRRYVHPDGYLMPNSGFTPRSAVRAEKFRRKPAQDITLSEVSLKELLGEVSNA